MTPPIRTPDGQEIADPWDGDPALQITRATKALVPTDPYVEFRRSLGAWNEEVLRAKPGSLLEGLQRDSAWARISDDIDRVQIIYRGTRSSAFHGQQVLHNRDLLMGAGRSASIAGTPPGLLFGSERSQPRFMQVGTLWAFVLIFGAIPLLLASVAAGMSLMFAGCGVFAFTNYAAHRFGRSDYVFGPRISSRMLVLSFGFAVVAAVAGFTL